MNANEVIRTSRQLGRVVAQAIQEEWARVERSAAGDPKGLAQGKVNIALTINTVGTGNHTMKLTIPGRAFTESYTVTPSDLEIPETDNDLEVEPGDPEPS